ncbi:type VI secretion system tip protein VgrG [Fulvivirga ulvae]|uniref:type VI secretion system tip protein VgrG n=1 Tax=Fulvivirga ulvae TaxID=2904245 RepID=UPI001F29B705|nr:type VI secretion system tip protein VgrG [Fulvivirga ulvae]UII31370.1 type VI secretion system tip protein VgrG [Fulvivirga ulvae]
MADTIIIKDQNKREIPGLRIMSVSTEHEFNKIPKAELKVIVGNPATQKYKHLDNGYFDIGKEIEILIKEERNMKSETKIFSGVVVSLSIEGSGSAHEGNILQVDLSDQAVKMTNSRVSSVYANKNDKDIISNILEKYKDKGLGVDSLAKTEVKHTQMVQNYVTDWDFIVSRAEANSQLVLVEEGKLSTVRPQIAGKARQEIEIGGTRPAHILDVNLQVNGSDQYTQVEARGWNGAKLQVTSPEKGTYELKTGNLDGEKVAQSFGSEGTSLFHPVPMGTEELQSWADSHMMKSRMSLLTGSVKLRGKDNKIKVGDTLEIKGVGKQNSGKNIVSRVIHECADSSSWTTEIYIGMGADWFSSSKNIVDTQAAGLLPGVNGLHVGIVQAFEEDKEKQYKVKVAIPAFGAEGTVWARLSSVYAGDKTGILFRPEKNDEVVVGFLNDDPRQVIILGAMHSSSRQVPMAVTKTNGQKGIFLKSGYRLLFDEDNEVVTLATSDENYITIDKKNKKITLADANENKIELAQSGISINTQGDLSINAKGKIKIEGEKIDLI